MNAQINNRSVFGRLRQVDQALSQVFQQEQNTDFVRDPELRYQLFAILFDGLGPYTPGIDREQLVTQLRDRIGETQWRAFIEPKEQLSDLLRAIVRPTYAVTSYLGPLYGRRQSAVHRDCLKDETRRKRTLAFTYAFYSLTLTGRHHGLYSGTQFILEHAQKKWSLPLCYEDEMPNGTDEWWHIPRWLELALLTDTGMEAAIQAIDSGERTEADLAVALRSLLANRDEASLADLDNFGSTGLSLFRNAAATAQNSVNRYVERTCTFLGAMFGEERPLQPELSMFMLMTYLIWRRAYPETTFAYTFPTLVRDHPCVLTIGTLEPLSPVSAHVLAHVGRTGFIHPLVNDYADMVAGMAIKAESADQLNWVLDGMHENKSQFNHLNTHLDQCRDVLRKADLSSAIYELDLIAASTKAIRNVEDRISSRANPPKEAVRLTTLVERARAKAVALGLNCTVSCDKNIFVHVDEDRVAAAFEELVENASHFCPKGSGAINIFVERVTLRLLATTNRLVLIQFEDNGPGIPDQCKEAIFTKNWTTRRGEGGDGVGLWSARRWLRAFDGNLVVRDGRSGNGALFEVSLPE